MNRKLLCVFAFMFFIFRYAHSEERYINVQAYGRGHDRKAAMENALEEALRRNMGMMIMSREELKDDNLTDKVIQVSRGSIRDAEVLSEERLSDEYILHVGFRIDTNPIIEAVTNYRKGSGGSFDIKRRTFIEYGREVIHSFFSKINLSDFIDVETEDRRIDIAGGELLITIRLTFNSEKYIREFYAPLNDVLDEILNAHEIDSELSLEDETVLYVFEDDRTLKAWRVPVPLWEAMKEGACLDDFDSKHILKTHKRLWVNLMMIDSEGHELSAERIPVHFPVTNIMFFSLRNDSSIWSLTGSRSPETVIVCAPLFGESDSEKNSYSMTYSDKRDPLEKRFIFHMPSEILSRINSVTAIMNPEK